ncbi:HNH endonuclease [Polycyclovorans algicola]|uniref:HNH endonuclease n=1 Tax=Polycyclovorans algicola TaxID=616992 RepID=UPI00344F6B5B
MIELAKLIGRTPSAVAMKLVNLASLDPSIVSTGRSGLGNASSLDREVWAEFDADWEGLAVECQRLRLERGASAPVVLADPDDDPIGAFTGETKAVLTERRVKQSFFRRAVLSGYRGRCCISGVSVPQLLVASHIVPWSQDKANRLNPRNGLCLSAIHDRAFDQGLIGLTDDFRLIVSTVIKKKGDPFLSTVLVAEEGKKIELPERFLPSVEFIQKHRKDVMQTYD